MAEFLFQSPFLSPLQTNVCLQPVGPERTKSWHDGQLYEFKFKLPVAPHLSMTVTEFFILHPGTGSNCTETAVYLSTEAKKAGADGLLLVSPYYNKSTQKGLKVHFSEVAKAVDLPILLYNVPSRTGVNITPETIVALCKEYENIVVVKEASGNFSAIAQIASLSG